MQHWTTEINHRGGLATQVESITPPPEMFQALGGREFVAQWVDELYDRLETDSELSPMFKRDLTQERAVQKDFFEEWFGGEPRYCEGRGGGCLEELHCHIWITPKAAGLWLKHAGAAMKALELDPQLRMKALMALGPVARALVNEKEAAPTPRHLRCERHKPLKDAVDQARRGMPDGLPAHPKVLLMAAERGRIEVVEQQLALGVDCNIASRLRQYGAPMRTPLCAALQKRRRKIVPLLLEAGAVLDLFSVATLGEIDCLRWILERKPELVQVTDPAEDFRKLRAIHYALEHGQTEAVQLLLEAGSQVHPGSARLLESALEDAPELAKRFLDMGASLATVGPGPWLTDPELRVLLKERGLKFQPHWIPDLCSGNHGRKDRPEWVRGALEFGLTGESSYRGRSAIEYAKRAGFTKTVELLS